MTSAYYYKKSYFGQGRYPENKEEMRIYNRGNGRPIETSKGEKQTLKMLGFRWDKHNHSYFLDNPSPAAIAAIKELMILAGGELTVRE